MNEICEWFSLSSANLVDDSDEILEVKAINSLAHFVQIFQIFKAVFIERCTLTLELVNNLFVAVKVGASVGVSGQIHDGFQGFEFIREIHHLVNFSIKSLLVGSRRVFCEFVDQILHLDVS